MATGFMGGLFGHPSTKASGVYAIKSDISNTISKIPILGSLYRTSKTLGAILLLIVGYIIYRKVK